MEYYILSFKNKVHPREIYFYRNFIVDKFARQYGYHYWHNHKDEKIDAGEEKESTQNIWRYPKVQYKIMHNRLAIVVHSSLEKEVYHLMQSLPLKGNVTTKSRGKDGVVLHHSQDVVLQWESLQRKEMATFPETGSYEYSCQNWIAMGTKDFQNYISQCKSLDLDWDQDIIEDDPLLDRLEEICALQYANALEQLGIRLEKELELKLATNFLSRRYTKPYGSHKKIGIFSKDGKRLGEKDLALFKLEELIIQTNYPWPIGWGLGKFTALGFGMLNLTDEMKQKKKNKYRNGKYHGKNR